MASCINPYHRRAVDQYLSVGLGDIHCIIYLILSYKIWSCDVVFGISSILTGVTDACEWLDIDSVSSKRFLSPPCG